MQIAAAVLAKDPTSAFRSIENRLTQQLPS
jgi:hypothetical protein